MALVLHWRTQGRQRKSSEVSQTQSSEPIHIRREQPAAGARISLFDSCVLLRLAQRRRRRGPEFLFYGAGEAQFTAITSMVIGRSRPRLPVADRPHWRSGV